MNKLCWFGFHDWKPIKVQWVSDTSWGITPGCSSTNVTLRCQRCSKITTKYHYNAGYLTLEEVSGSQDRSKKSN